MSRYFIELSYNGNAYHGWQIQPNAITVQSVLNNCLSKVLREEINVVGCGRTDTGVHAKYFVAHFDCSSMSMEENRFCYKLNSFLPNDIALYSIKKVDGDAHSRFSAISRVYEYHLVKHKDPFLQDFAYQYTNEIDFSKMNEAASILLEYIDFTSFSKLHTDVKTNNCAISYAKWEYVNGKWIFTIKADRFLRNMVRAIVGTLLEVGKGKLDIDGFRKTIEAKSRSNAGVSAPACALYLTDIEYPTQLYKPVWKKY